MFNHNYCEIRNNSLAQLCTRKKYKIKSNQMNIDPSMKVFTIEHRKRLKFLLEYHCHMSIS